MENLVDFPSKKIEKFFRWKIYYHGCSYHSDETLVDASRRRVSHRMRGHSTSVSSNAPSFDETLVDAIIQWLKTRIARSLKHGHTVRIPWHKQELFHEFNLMCSRTVLSMVLRKLVGAKWGRCIVQKGANFGPASGAAKAKSS